MKNLSSKREVLQRKYRKVMLEIVEERGPICEGCGANTFTFSHRIARSRNINLLAVKDNIDLYCHTCHNNYETAKFWLLKNGDQVKEWLREYDHELYVKKVDKEKVSRLFDSHLSRNIRNLTERLRVLEWHENTLEAMEKDGLIKPLQGLAELHYERLV